MEPVEEQGPLLVPGLGAGGRGEVQQIINFLGHISNKLILLHAMSVLLSYPPVLSDCKRVVLGHFCLILVRLGTNSEGMGRLLVLELMRLSTVLLRVSSEYSYLKGSINLKIVKQAYSHSTRKQFKAR